MSNNIFPTLCLLCIIVYIKDNILYLYPVDIAECLIQFRMFKLVIYVLINIIRVLCHLIPMLHCICHQTSKNCTKVPLTGKRRLLENVIWPWIRDVTISRDSPFPGPSSFTQEVSYSYGLVLMSSSIWFILSSMNAISNSCVILSVMNSYFGWRFEWCPRLSP